LSNEIAGSIPLVLTGGMGYNYQDVDCLGPIPDCAFFARLIKTLWNWLGDDQSSVESKQKPGLSPGYVCYGAI
jgi:hypothetical protein